MNKKSFFVASAVLLIFLIFTASCGKQGNSEKIKNTTPESDLLTRFLEQNGDYINSNAAPSNIDAGTVYNNLKNNILIIDIRDAEAYGAGHIKSAVNILPDSLISYFENVVEPNSFDTIVFVCDIGSRSAFITGIFRLLGYNNTFSMKYGMCAWNSRFADVLWLKNLSSHLENTLEVTENALPEKIYTPVINTGELLPYNMLRARAQALLSDTLKKYFVGIGDIENRLSDYFIIHYAPEQAYKSGHLKGAYRFEPRMSLKRQALLSRIPTDKPVVIYCNSGTQSAFVTAYLRILGYEAFSLKYGTNSFKHNLMTKDTPEHTFSKAFVNEFPVETSLPQTGVSQQMESLPVKVKGGC